MTDHNLCYRQHLAGINTSNKHNNPHKINTKCWGTEHLDLSYFCTDTPQTS